ncbi:MAG: hypothetical protein RIE73_13175 [Coleofasciculus sp. C1-SOL-03]
MQRLYNGVESPNRCVYCYNRQTNNLSTKPALPNSVSGANIEVLEKYIQALDSPNC